MEYDIEKIKKQFKEVITYSQDIANPQVDKLFDRWLKAKKKFIDALKGELIYEYPEEVCFEMNAKDKYNKIGDFITDINLRYHNHDLEYFIEQMRDGFYSNTVNKDYEYKDIVIPKGMKLVKAFKYFVDDKETLLEIQMAASRVIQEDKIKGKLCISVHPLDYLSSSENTHNWRSCHALDGEYRAGNLSYMVDSSTVVTYLKSDKDAVLPNFPPVVPWNNKKWRTLLHFSNNWQMIFAGRSYPFSSDTGMNYVLKYLISSLFAYDKDWKDWDSANISTFTMSDNSSFGLNAQYYPIGGKLVDIYDLITIPGHSLNYNDVLYSNYYTPLYTTRWHLNMISTLTHFTIGGSVNCLRNEEHRIELPETMQCIDCEETYGTCESESFVYCTECGARIYEDNALFLHNGSILCDSCAFDDGYAVQCKDCGEWLHIDEAHIITDEENNITGYLCWYCAQDRCREDD